MRASTRPSKAVRVFLITLSLFAAAIGVQRSQEAPASPELRLCAVVDGPGNDACEQADARVQVSGACSNAPATACAQDADCPAGAAGRCKFDNQNFGFAAARGFIDDDEIADVVVGAPGKNRVYVFLGGVDRFSIRGSCSLDPAESCESDVDCGTGPCIFALPDLDPEAQDVDVEQRRGADIVLEGPSGSQFGFSVAVDVAVNPACDPDAFVRRVIVGAPAGSDPAQPGSVYVVGVEALEACSLDEAPCPVENPPGTPRPGVTRVRGEANGSRTGYSVAVGPDLQLVVGAPRFGSTKTGRVYVIDLPDCSGSISLAQPPAGTVVRVTGSATNRGLGESLVVADLVGGNGVDEIAIGAVGTAAGTSNPAGRVYVVPWPQIDNVLSDTLNDGAGCLTTDSSNDFFGFSVAAGDFDGGGRELVVGAILGDRDSTPAGQNSGVVYVFEDGLLGGAGFLTATQCTTATADPNAINYERLLGARAWDQLGFSVVAGDLVGDAFDDLAVAARWHDRAALTLDPDWVDEGAVYVLRGASLSLADSAPVAGSDVRWPADLACVGDGCVPQQVTHMLRGGDFELRGGSDEIGFSMAAGDLNGAGALEDLLIGSITNERVYVVSLSDADGDGRRDVLDADDDGDGYLDVQEDCNLNGKLDTGETDPFVRNRDVGITIGIDRDGDSIVDSPSVSCGPAIDTQSPAFWVQVDITNHSAADAIEAPEPNLLVDLGAGALYEYVPGSTELVHVSAEGAVLDSDNLGDINGDMPFLTEQTAAVPAGRLERNETARIRFKLRPKQNVGLAPASEEFNASASPSPGEIVIEPCDPAIETFPNQDEVAVELACPDLTLEYVAEPEPCPGQQTPAEAVAGACLRYRAHVENHGRAPASQVEVVATLDPEIIFPVSPPPPGSGGSCACTMLSPPPGSVCLQVTCSLGTVGVNGSADADFLTRIRQDAVADTTLENLARVTSSDGEASGQNNDATGARGATNDTVIAASADMEVADATCPANAVPGTTISYAFAIENLGPSNAAAVEIEVLLPPGVSFASSNCNTLPGVLSVTVEPDDSTTVSCQLAGGPLPPQTPRTLTVVGQVDPGSMVASFETRATVGSVTVDPNTPAAGLAGSNVAICPTTVVPDADLRLTKSVDLLTANAGETLVYTLTVENQGPSTAPNVVVTDMLPTTTAGALAVENILVQSCPGPWSVDLGQVTCNLGPLPVDAIRTFEIRVKTLSNLSSGTVLENQAGVGSDAGDSVPSDNQVEQVLTSITTSADLAVVDVLDGTTTVLAGIPLTYSFTVRNDGPSNAANVTITDLLPQDLDGNPLVQYQGTIRTPADVSCELLNPSTVVCTATSLAAGAKRTVDLEVLVLSSVQNNVTLRNRVTIDADTSDPDTLNNSGEDNDTVVIREVDLNVVSFLDRPFPLLPQFVAGTGIEYEVRIENGGPSDAADVQITVDLPQNGVENQVEAPSASNCATPLAGHPALGGVPTYDLGTNRFTCALPTVETGQAPTLVLRSTIASDAANDAPDGTLLTARANVASDEDDADAPALDTTTLLAQAVLTAQKTATAALVAGEPLSYVINVTNNGPSDALAVVIGDLLPAELTFEEALCPDGVLAQAGQQLTCSLDGPLPPGAGYEFRLTAKVSRSVSNGDSILNTATITSDDAAPVAAQHSAMVGALSDVQVTIVSNLEEASADDVIVYTIIVHNFGPSAVLNNPADPFDFQVENTLPEDIVVTGETCPGLWQHVPGTNTATCELVGDLPAGQLRFFTVTGTVTASAFDQLDYTAKVIWPTAPFESTTSLSVAVCSTEICDGLDNDCDGSADFPGETTDGDADGTRTCADCDDANANCTTDCTDADADGFCITTDCNDASPNCTSNCTDTDVDGYCVTTDCDDADGNVNPGATEVCGNAIDDDCDGAVDDDGVGATTWYADTDTDTYGDPDASQSACVQPAGHVADNTDCDNADENVNPGATEVCGNAIDDDCDGAVDDDGVGATTWYADIDTDMYGDPDVTQTACAQPAGYVADNTDCDDADENVNPGATEVCGNAIDDDCDGTVDDDGVGAAAWYADIDTDMYGDPNVTQTACVQPAGHVADNTDCDDSDENVNPAATEVCGNAIDDDCDGAVDDDGVGATAWYADTDTDTYGDPNVTQSACVQPAGHVADNTDCDDADENVNPGATEVCGNAIDDDCDGAVDDDGVGATTWYADTDTDTYGDPNVTQSACVQPADHVADNTDCDDADENVNPGATEVCGNAIDDDCEGAVDDDGVGATTWYADTDTDTYGDPNVTQSACVQPAGHVADNTDCDDADENVNPGATEVCGNAIDDDCDGAVDDDGVGATTWYADTDTDTYGDPNVTQSACVQPAGHVADNTDCDDADENVNPGATEVCGNAIDDDCDGAVDDDGVGATTWYADTDTDTYGDPNVTQSACVQPAGHVADNTDCDDADENVNPGATEVCGNAIDDDCDLVADSPGCFDLVASGDGALRWSPLPAARSYNVYRGSLRDLRETGRYIQYGMSAVANRACGLAAPEYSDAWVPLAGEPVFYLVTVNTAGGEVGLPPQELSAVAAGAIPTCGAVAKRSDMLQRRSDILRHGNDRTVREEAVER